MPSSRNFIQRKPITQAVRDALETVGRPVGLAEAPRGGVAGWTGDPNAAGTTFRPYCVLTPMTAGLGSGPLDATQSDVALPYAVTSYGVSAEQCEDSADLLRAALITLGQSKTTVAQWSGSPEEYGRRIQTVLIQSYGQVQRAGQTDPAYYGQTDLYTLLTSA